MFDKLFLQILGKHLNFSLALEIFFMVSIRLARGGSKKRPFYHLTVSDHRRARDGALALEGLADLAGLAGGKPERRSVAQAFRGAAPCARSET